MELVYKYHIELVIIGHETVISTIDIRAMANYAYCFSLNYRYYVTLCWILYNTTY